MLLIINACPPSSVLRPSSSVFRPHLRQYQSDHDHQNADNLVRRQCLMDDEIAEDGREDGYQVGIHIGP